LSLCAFATLPLKEEAMSGTIRTFRDLLVWQKAMRLVTKLYRVSASFPKEEIYGITSQMRRCAVSIPSNIAEGFGRQSTGDYVRFLSIAEGSLYELQTQLEISLNLTYLTSEQYESLDSSTREIERMLTSLIRKLKAKQS
jgi:four helix bundle protein